MYRIRAFVPSLVAAAGLAVVAGCESATVPTSSRMATPNVEASMSTSNFGAQLAYVANIVSNSVSVIDVATQTVTATVGVGSAPQGVAVTPDGSLAYEAHRPRHLGRTCKPPGSVANFKTMH